MLRRFLIRAVVNAFALAVVVTLLPQGIRIVAEDQNARFLTLAGVAVIFGLVNAFVKPLVKLLTCPFILFTFGLFLLVINGAMFMLTAYLSQYLPGSLGRLEVDSFLWAIAGGLLMGIIGVITEKVFRLDDDGNGGEKVTVVREVRYVERPAPPPEGYGSYPPPGSDPYGGSMGPDPYGPPPPGEKPKRR